MTDTFYGRILLGNENMREEHERVAQQRKEFEDYRSKRTALETLVNQNAALERMHKEMKELYLQLLRELK